MPITIYPFFQRSCDYQYVGNGYFDAPESGQGECYCLLLRCGWVNGILRAAQNPSKINSQQINGLFGKKEKHFHLFLNIIIAYEILIKYTFSFLFQDKCYSLKL